MFQKALNLSSIVLELFYTVEVVSVVQVELGCSACIKVVLNGEKMCGCLSCLRLCCVGSFDLI